MSTPDPSPHCLCLARSPRIYLRGGDWGMLSHAGKSGLTLIELGDMGRDVLPVPVSVAYEKPIREVIEWASTYLSRPHPDIGRRGHVCPFVKTSMHKGLFYLAVQPGVPGDVTEVADSLREYRDWFIELAAESGAAAHYTTILVLFPELPPDKVSGIIDGAQDLLKVDYVSHGLMIGEFHDGPPAKPGLWNPGFRPLRSPVPLLAMRHMVPTDFPFLKDDPEYLAQYLDRYGRDLPPQVAEDAMAAAREFGLEALLAAPGEVGGA
ncbi:DUF6875 domain-containing protein [Streptomyces sp. NPDC097640]|uniref:DUF6875 domain-containing protein n=1 Tax=Streptomyces sp. NPDC097640 TaxID=3157229 RepID=UPI00331D5E3F